MATTKSRGDWFDVQMSSPLLDGEIIRHAAIELLAQLSFGYF